MSTFARTFSIDLINGQVLEENPWFKDMLLYWRPAGDALHRDMTEARRHVSSSQMPEEDPKRLRLAIRDRYLNLYRGGQSVAKIGFGNSGRLQARINNKYVHGDKGGGQAYVTLTSAGVPDQETGRLREYSGLAELRGWASNANKHVSAQRGDYGKCTTYRASWPFGNTFPFTQKFAWVAGFNQGGHFLDGRSQPGERQPGSY